MKDEIIAVTGASKGIGRATALKLASEGYHLLISDIEDMSSVGSDAKKLGVRVYQVGGDISEISTIRKIEAAVKRSNLRLKGVVNSAFAMVGKPFLQLTQDDWQRTFNVSFFAVVMLCRKLIPVMIDAKGGSIVNISSVHSLASGDIDSAAYDAAKAALNALTRSLAVEFGPAGIRVNAILPGLITSERVLDWKSSNPDEFRASEITHALQRAGHPAEVAEAVSFLISDRSSFITGSSMLVDGGQMASINETAALKLLRLSSVKKYRRA